MSDLARRGPPNVCVLSLTNVADEPRVRRQCATLIERGWTASVVGYRGRSPLPKGWEIIELDPARVITHGPSSRLVLSRVLPGVAESHYWRQPGYRYIYEQIRSVPCALVIAHDYFTAPLAAQLAAERGVPYVIDCHEYARGQFSMAGSWKRRLRWMALERPYIDALQRRFLTEAALVTTVCDGIGRLLHEEYRLAIPPTVVRGTPVYQEMPFRPTGEIIRVLYHGLLVPTRGMEQAIVSVKLWRPEFRLVIRGVGDSAYIDSLRRLATELGVEDRVEFPPPVSFTELVETANACDVGYVVLENFSPQRRFTLPNKFFEYIMAGLAICASDLPELSRITQKYDLGVLVAGIDPQEIAGAVNALTRETIDAYKRRALAAARELCWEQESVKFTAALTRALPGFDRLSYPADSAAAMR